MSSPQEVLDFWFKDPKKWYTKDENFDKEIKRKFEGTLNKFANGELKSWMDTAKGAVALIVVCDQFPRNMYRNTAKCYAYDPKCLALSKDAIKRGYDKQLQGAVEFLNVLCVKYLL